MKTLLLALALLLAPGAAWAGCANYTDGTITEPAPEVTLCFGDDCQATKLMYECGNVHMAMYAFDNRWEVSIGDASWAPDQPNEPILVVDGAIVPRDRHELFRCAGDEEICGFLHNILFEQPSPEAAAAIDAWNTAHYECRMMETRGGKPLSLSESDGRCKARAKLNDTLVKLGQCWDAPEQSWEACP